MGAWGPGLYSNDFAMDLRATLKALARLPYDGDRLVDLASETAPSEAVDATHEDHATFWLVVADQFDKRGLVSSVARQRAIEILDSGADERMLRELGMSAAHLRKRSGSMADLRRRLASGTRRE